MTDLVFAAALLGAAVTLASSYALRALLTGEPRPEIPRSGTVVSDTVRDMGQWAFLPLGRALSHAGVAPGTVTLVGLALGLAAGGAFALGRFGLGAFLFSAAAAADCVDGLVARESGRGTRAGAALDAVADRYQEFAILLGVAFAYRHHGAWLLLVLVAVLGTSMSGFVASRAQGHRPRFALRRPARSLLLVAGAAVTPLLSAALSSGRPAWAAELPMLFAIGVVAAFTNASAALSLSGLAEKADQEDHRVFPRLGPAAARVREGMRQRFSALVSAAVDLTVMIVAVEGMGAPPALAAAAGGATGALLSFSLGRRWTHDVADDALAHQAARYALVAATAVGFNAMGEGVAVALGVNYVLARLVIAAAVGALWSAPMQQHYVFRRDPTPAVG
ncbi:MAG: CDP-alcohol phosphatidyltransferase family protein [Polyangiales bacterium]